MIAARACETPRTLAVVLLVSTVFCPTANAFRQGLDSLSQVLTAGQMDLTTTGRDFFLRVASASSFFLVGGLHGDLETQQFVQMMVDGAGRSAYAAVVVEMSPWAAERLEAPRQDGGPRLLGTDIEESHLDGMIREFAELNAHNAALDSAVDITRNGYNRPTAPQLLQLVERIDGFADVPVGGISLHRQILSSLTVEAARANRSAGRLAASALRERVMKEFFLAQYRATLQRRPEARFIVNLGQSHLGRGIDLRGVSTLGNFIAELAVAKGLQSFHVLLFAAGGQIAYGGRLQDADQRKDALAFDFLATLARYPATLFDLRSLRQSLHGAATLSPRDSSLLYWADAYDAVVCYRLVTPLQSPRMY